MASKQVQTRGPIQIEEFPVSGSTNIEAGDNVSVDVTGYSVQGGDTASTTAMGICYEDCDNSDGAAAAKFVKVVVAGDVAVPSNLSGSATRADVGKRLNYASATKLCLSGAVVAQVQGVSAGHLADLHESLSNTVWIRVKPQVTDPNTNK